MGPLTGFKVIDITSVLMGPFATQFLGDFGADVIKVEPPAGDVMRGVGPARSARMGPLYLNSNRSKRSIVLDLKTAQGRALVLDLCRSADVLVYNLRPAAMKRLGLSWDAIREINPRIIYAGLYGFGQGGRYSAKPAYDDLIQGAAGLSHLMLASGASVPRYVPLAVADRIVGLTGLSGILAALIARERSGAGQRVDVPMFETMVHFVMSDHLGGLSFVPPAGLPGYSRLLAENRRPFPTADGYICAMVYTDEQWQRFLTAIGRPEMAQDSRFAGFAARSDNVDHVYGWLGDIFRSRSSADWIELLDGADVPVMAMNTLETILNDPHLADRGFFVTEEHPTEGRILTMANPVGMSETPPATSRPAPGPGVHTFEILREIGLSDQQIDALVGAGIVADGPMCRTVDDAPAAVVP